MTVRMGYNMSKRVTDVIESEIKVDESQAKNQSRMAQAKEFVLVKSKEEATREGQGRGGSVAHSVAFAWCCLPGYRI